MQQRNRPLAAAPATKPGQYVRDTALTPNRVSVAQAAKILGVGRPALSNFLNGKAALSPDMAARIERAFAIPAQKLLDMQVACDAAQTKAKGPRAEARAYVPPFLGIKANDIEDWVKGNISARARLPVFLRSLVNSTGIGLTMVDFPGNDDAQRAGPDGMVDAAEGTPWIPEGKSVWEFGCDQNPKGKADHDYENKTKATEQLDRDETTFVFITPRRWPGKQKWMDDRRAEKRWKDVVALDASDLEQWLEQSVPAQAWFAAETHRASNGASSLDKCWADWANVSDPPLVGSLFAPAIKVAGPVIESRLAKPPEDITLIAADSTDEGLAFLAQLFTEDGDLARYRDRVVVFQEPGVLPKLAAGSSDFIAIAATREVEREFGPYCRDIHCVSVYPRNAANVDPHVILEPLHATAFSTSLEEMKFGRDEIDRLSRESGCSLTVLRRRLAKVPAIRTPEWAKKSDTAARLVPFLFAGTWSSANESDRIIVSLFGGDTDYSLLERKFQELTGLNDAPVWSVGAYRGVVSKIDLLFAISGAITEADIRNYIEVARLVLSEDDPSLDLPEEQQWAAGMYGKTREISAALRNGVSETLVLLAVHGNALFQERIGINVELLVAQLIRDLLTPLTTRTLEAQERDLPTYAEAAPHEFLSILEADLDGAEPASLGLMRPADSTFGRCVRTGLLWALEGLAWSPSTLPSAALVLAKLAQVQIDDNWVNKPIESLRSIFRSWMPQTEATLEQRIEVLKRLAEESPKIAWQVCVDQFGDTHQVGHYSHKPQWRNEGHGFGEVLHAPEVHAFQVAMVKMALDWKGHDRETLGDLITRLHALGDDWQEIVWDLVKRWADSGASDGDRAWVREKIRVAVLSQRAVRRHKGPRADQLRIAAEEARKALEPSDVISKHEWLFRQDWVEESADELHSEELDFHGRAERIANLRTAALNEVVAKRGVDGVLELADMGQAAGRIGWLMPAVVPADQIAGLVLAAMPPNTDSWARKSLVSGVLHKLEDGPRRTLLEQIRDALSPEAFVDILKLAPFTRPTWTLVDERDDASQAAYWASVVPEWLQQDEEQINLGIERLLAAKRPRAALAWIHFVLEKVRPALLFRLLSEIATGKDEPPGHYRLDGYYIATAFELLDKSREFSIDQMAGLEFPYVEVLSRKRGTSGARGIPNLERYIEKHPEFFAEVVSWVFRRSDGKTDAEGTASVDPALAKTRAELGYRLLDALERIPGRDKAGEIDADEFYKWLSSVRQSCAALGRQDTGDIVLGEFIASAPPAADGIWPCEPVRDALERVKSKDMGRGIHTGLYNQRGVHFRPEGGAPERELAAKFHTWAKALEFSHPYVSSVIRRLAETYDHEAKGQDTEARVQRRLRH